MNRFFWSTLVVVLSIGLTACSGSRRAAAPAGPAATDAAPTPRVDLSRYEDFDPSPYRDTAPAAATEIQHDVPERLMSGRTEGRTPRSVQGYRIQIYSTRDKSAADQLLEEAAAWWRAETGRAVPGLFSGVVSQPPLYIIYRQPYYRIRIGDFATRQEAQRALGVVEQHFPGAFIAPDVVTVLR